jgi:Concanavalin A-like lectin/glucanases superfamily/FKBP-type peptidyl-prolyl cis-trans isomerase
MRFSGILIICVTLVPLAHAQIPPIDAPVQTQYTTKFADIRVGTGARAEPGKVYVFHVTVWLANGKKMFSTYDNGVPTSFEQGSRKATPGIDAGFEGMRVGGKRRLFVPYQLSGGEKGGGGWPPKMDTIYDIELLDVRDPRILRKTNAAAGAHYQGISADQPTGSPAISVEALVAAYDMATLTPDGKLRDFSRKANHGIVQGTEVVPGLFGQARRFSAVTDRIALASSPAFDVDGPLSVAVWIRLNRGGLHQHVLACDDKFALWFTEDNKIRFVDSTGHGFQSDDAFAVGQWHSMAGVFRGTKGDSVTADNLTVFVDGQELAGNRFGKWSPGTLHPSDACYLGFESHQGLEDHKSLLFAGDIDELLVFARPLSDNEIGAHAARPH